MILTGNSTTGSIWRWYREGESIPEGQALVTFRVRTTGGSGKFLRREDLKEGMQSTAEFPGMLPSVITMFFPISGLCLYWEYGDPCPSGTQGLFCPEEQRARNWTGHPQIHLFPGMELLMNKGPTCRQLYSLFRRKAFYLTEFIIYACLQFGGP